MGGAVAILSTIASVASNFSHRQSRSNSNEGLAAAAARREARERERMEERRKRLTEQRDDERERERLRQQKRGAMNATVATSGAGVLGQADVGRSGLKTTLGE